MPIDLTFEETRRNEGLELQNETLSSQSLTAIEKACESGTLKPECIEILQEISHGS